MSKKSRDTSTLFELITLNGGRVKGLAPTRAEQAAQGEAEPADQPASAAPIEPAPLPELTTPEPPSPPSPPSPPAPQEPAAAEPAGPAEQVATEDPADKPADKPKAKAKAKKSTRKRAGKAAVKVSSADEQPTDAAQADSADAAAKEPADESDEKTAEVSAAAEDQPAKKRAKKAAKMPAKKPAPVEPLLTDIEVGPVHPAHLPEAKPAGGPEVKPADKPQAKSAPDKTFVLPAYLRRPSRSAAAATWARAVMAATLGRFSGLAVAVALMLIIFILGFVAGRATSPGDRAQATGENTNVASMGGAGGGSEHLSQGGGSSENNGGGDQAVANPLIDGMYYLVIQELPGNSPQDKQDAEAIAAYCNGNGRPADVRPYSPPGQGNDWVYCVLSLKSFDDPHSSAAMAFAGEIESLGRQYKADPQGGDYLFEQRSPDGQLAPNYQPWYE